MKRIAYIIRVLTVAPLMALVMLLTLYLNDPLFFGSTFVFALSVVFLSVFPLLGYPMQRVIKKYRDKGREGQRELAFIFAVGGYIFGCLTAIFLRAPRNVLIIFISYLISGLLAVIINKLFHFKASGHACGVTGPFALLAYFGSPAGYAGIPVLALVWLSSIYMKRHTHLQLLAGAIIPFIALGIITAALLITG